MTLKEKRAAAIAAAQGIIQKAKSSGVPLTKGERDTLAETRAEVERLTGLIEKSDADEAMFAQFGGGHRTDASGAKALSFKGVKDRILRPDGEQRNIKALVAAGSQVVPTSDIDLIVYADRPVTAFMEAIPAQEVDENFSFLRQTVRTNSAAPVAVGALKPTSVFTLTRVEKRLKVVAHLSEPIPEYWLKDAPALEQFVQNEMLSGLAEAVAAQFLNGTGVGENLEGISTASGIQLQGFVVDKVETARRGLGALETLGMEGALFVFNPSDWISIETMRLSGGTGGFVMENAGAPIDRVRRQLWGVPVALSTAVPVGTAYVIAREAVRLFHDGTVQVAWGTIGDDFGRNQVRCRAEGRFEAGALRPSGIVQIDLTA